MKKNAQPRREHLFRGYCVFGVSEIDLVQLRAIVALENSKEIEHFACMKEKQENTLEKPRVWTVEDSELALNVKELSFPYGTSPRTCQKFLEKVTGCHLFALTRNKKFPYLNQVNLINEIFEKSTNRASVNEEIKKALKTHLSNAHSLKEDAMEVESI